MDKQSLIKYIESSFLKDIASLDSVTDITYNGKDIYYVSNLLGRQKYDKSIASDVVKDFIRQLANITEKQFSYLSPILDVNVGRYRINAVNTSVARVGLEEAISFSVRIASSHLMINHDEKYMSVELEELFDFLIANHISIVICGVTGVGKTEFQKYLISRMKENERIIIVDQTIELAGLTSINDSLDITLWQANEKIIESNVSSLIKNGLRNNPDWMIVSEARGEEMNDVLNSAMTGIPIITTIHSFDAKSAPSRMARMIMASKQSISYEDIISNLNYHFRIFVYLKKEDKNGKINRYISSIIQSDSDGKQYEIYRYQDGIKKYGKMSEKFLKLVNFPKNNKFLKGFLNV